MAKASRRNTEKAEKAITKAGGSPIHSAINTIFQNDESVRDAITANLKERSAASQALTDRAKATRAAKSPPLQQPRTTFATRLKRPLPAKSVAKATSAFKKFSLSKFAGQSTPSNYVPAGEAPAAVHRKIIAQHLHKLSKADTSNRAMTLALPEATIKKLLPSLNAKASTIDLSDVMKLIAQNMRGTEFYANGNPTLNRLALQSRVQQIITTVKQATVKQGVKK